MIIAVMIGANGWGISNITPECVGVKNLNTKLKKMWHPLVKKITEGFSFPLLQDEENGNEKGKHVYSTL